VLPKNDPIKFRAILSHTTAVEIVEKYRKLKFGRLANEIAPKTPAG